MSDLVQKGLQAKRESKYVDFKRSFDPGSAGEWCELIKDIIAMANSGGGVIVIGLDNGGNPSRIDVRAVLELDQATIVDKIRKYIGHEFTEIELHEAVKQTQTIAVIEISAVKIPFVFQSVGTYEASPGKQKTAFSKGTIYFRHGAKSEPGTTDDIREVIERRLESIRSEWLDGVRKITRAPIGSTVAIFSGEVRESNSPDAVPIRFVEDPSAPGYRIIDHDITYPYRQKELIEVVNAMLPDGVEVNSYDLLAARRVHKTDDNLRFCHTPKFGSQQYSGEFAKWLVAKHKENNNFFAEARDSYYQQMHSNS